MTDSLLVHGPDDGDWNDVRRRSRRSVRRRRGGEVAAALAVAVVAVASAYALGHPVVDFGKAQHGSLKQVNEFGSMQVGAPRGMAPGVLPHEARRITAVRIDGKEHVLYVAPTKQGGFCADWSDFGGGCPREPPRPVCVEARRRRRDRPARADGAAGLVGQVRRRPADDELQRRRDGGGAVHVGDGADRRGLLSLPRARRAQAGGDATGVARSLRQGREAADRGRSSPVHRS